MTSIKAYFLRLIFCSFLVSLSGTLLRDRRSGKVLRLCGGCLLILTALRPLVQVDLSRLPNLVTGLTQVQRQEEAQARNEAILRTLIEDQTAAWIAEQGRALGMEIIPEVTLRGASGTFVPDAVTIRGNWTGEGRQTLTQILAQELDIPVARQNWVGG